MNKTMSKVKALLGGNTAPAQSAATASGAPVRKPFLSVLGTIAAPFEKPATPSDPVERMRAKFATNADATIKAIQDGAEKGKWFRKLPDGTLVVSFRNANSALSLNGASHFQVADAASAVALLEAAKAGVAAGELDDSLKATQRKPPVRKKKQDAPAA
jgi:hypothetical protein